MFRSTYSHSGWMVRGDEVLTLDARPSDSIVVALRLNAKIFADDDLLKDALSSGEPNGAEEEKSDTEAPSD